MSWLKKILGISGVWAASSSGVLAEEPITIEDLVPAWKPSVERDIDKISERCHFYLNQTKTIVVFSHGTCVIVDDGLPGDQSYSQAKTKLSGFLKAHPDFTPMEMKDGNMVVNTPHIDTLTVVLKETMATHADLIEENHQKAIPSHEVILTPLGHNIFESLGYNALFGRSFIFWDAQELQPVKLLRSTR